ncbi:MAG TPA: TonB-dependent receptor [Rhodoblastus sp.]|nr:TonB-dependent receptor [Rhodoblastus sp.]
MVQALAGASILIWSGQAPAQTALPDVNVIVRQDRPAAKPRKAPRRQAERAASTRAAHARAPRRQPQTTVPRPTSAPPATDEAAVADAVPAGAPVGATTRALDAARQRLLPHAGAATYTRDASDIEAAPQGANASVDKVLLQAPGVTQDSAAGGAFHVRNEHANVQYRINGIMIPDGASGFGQLLDTSFVRSLSLVTGALPAQYGLRASGVVDIATKAGTATPQGSVSVYGGSHGTATTSFDYGGSTKDGWDYFAAGRLRGTSLGIENTTPGHEALHDRARQGSYFIYASKALDADTRVTFMSGGGVNKYQIPNTPLQQPQFTAFGLNVFDSTRVDENQVERNFFNVAALQKTVGDVDMQIAFFSRYSDLHFTPDTLADLIFNGVASDVRRKSFLNGVQGDFAWRATPDHTIRAGFMGSVERTSIVNANTLFPLDANGDPVDAAFRLTDASSKTGVTLSAYLQDEWRLTDRLTLNAGLRLDHYANYSSASQASPRASLVYKPFDGTTLHAGYARYFTPVPQLLSAPANLALYLNTTQQPEVLLATPVRPERSDYFDVGIEQRVAPGLDVGVDAYFKRTKNLADDGQFGSALVLSGFNYDRGYNSGVEFKTRYVNGDFRAYGNLAWGRQRARLPSSNQYLFGADEYSYISANYIYTDHAQTLTASAGASYKWNDTRFSVDMIYASGLRAGDFNTGKVSPYAQVNAGLAHEFKGVNGKPLTLRVDVVNLFDHAYQIRDGSGIGVFAAQYGPRRSIYAGLTQKF